MVRINEGVALVPELACINIQGFSYLFIKDMDFYKNILFSQKKVVC